MRHHLASGPEPCIIPQKNCVVFRNKEWDNFRFPLLSSASSIKWHDPIWGSLSELEITYKSVYFNKQTINLTKSQIINDLVWSLSEESEINKLVVRPSSINVDFFLEKVDIDLDSLVRNNQIPTPIPANKITNFVFQFRIFNPNPDIKKILKTVPVHPFHEVDITVTLSKSEIRPFTVPVYAHRQKTVKWGLVPIEGSQFEVAIETKYPSKNLKHFRVDSLSLLHNRSKFISETASHHDKHIGIVNTPTYRDFSSIAAPYLIGLTADQVKKDLETWYGSLSAFHNRLMIKDIQKLISIMEMKLWPSRRTGKHESYISAFFEDADVRYSVYRYARFDESLVKAFDMLFGSVDDPKEYNINSKELLFLLKGFSSTLKDLESNLEVKLTWKKEPELSISDEEDNSPYPAVSFEFDQEIIFKKQIIIPFKGCWNDNDGKFEYKDEKSSCGSGAEFFDLSKKLDNLNKIVQPLQKMLGNFVINKLIPNASQFIGWEKWEIDKEEKIVNKYKAVKSPIRPAIDSSNDRWEKRRIIPGWKAMDITVTHDLSNFYKFFYKIYEKLDKYKNSSWLNLTTWTTALNIATSIADIKKTAKDNPVAFVVHIINQLFDEKYFDKNKTSEENKRPWPVFFKTLLSKPINIDSTQLFVGYSRSMFDVEPWVDDIGTTEGSSKTYKVSDDWQSKEVNKKKQNIEDSHWKFPVEYKHRDLETLVESYNLNYSKNFPKAPMIMKILDKNNKKWDMFLKKEGKYNIGFIKYKDLIKNALIDAFHNHVEHPFPDKKFMDWNKVKVSVSHLEFEKALKSVLNLKNQLSTGLNTALGTYAGASIDFNTLLGEFIQRDFMIITVNMMAEEGSMLVIRKPLRTHKKSVYSLYQFYIEPDFDLDKLSGGIPKIREKFKA